MLGWITFHENLRFLPILGVKQSIIVQSLNPNEDHLQKFRWELQANFFWRKIKLWKTDVSTDIWERQMTWLSLHLHALQLLKSLWWFFLCDQISLVLSGKKIKQGDCNNYLKMLFFNPCVDKTMFLNMFIIKFNERFTARRLHHIRAIQMQRWEKVKPVWNFAASRRWRAALPWRDEALKQQLTPEQQKCGFALTLTIFLTSSFWILMFVFLSSPHWNNDLQIRRKHRFECKRMFPPELTPFRLQPVKDVAFYGLSLGILTGSFSFTANLHSSFSSSCSAIREQHSPHVSGRSFWSPVLYVLLPAIRW